MSISGHHINTTGPLTNYPCVYFKRCIASKMFQLMTIMINVYAEQNAVRRDKHASVHEKEALLELNMAIGVLDFSQSVNALGFKRKPWDFFSFSPIYLSLTIMTGHTKMGFYKVRPLYDSE